MSNPSVIEYVLSRLHSIGITDVFGVPGDYSFPINDAICQSKLVKWIGCCNELNAAYAADGYARIKGFGAVCTTFGVGELSAINGIAGAYAEHLPIFHLVGTPNSRAQSSRLHMHHTLGNGEYSFFNQMTDAVVCAKAVMTPQNVVFETERLIQEALYHRRPVYMAFPADLAVMPVDGDLRWTPGRSSHPRSLATAVDAICDALAAADTACVLPGILLARTGLQQVMTELLDISGLPFATMLMGKSVIDEQHPGYAGIYNGKLMNEDVRLFVESRDLVIEAGTLLTDFNTGAFTASRDVAKTIVIAHHHVQVAGKIFSNVEISDILAELIRRWPAGGKKWEKLTPQGAEPVTGASNDPITAASLYPRWEDFLAPGDILVAETGTVSMGLGFARMPAGATFHNQTLWGSIGWATPAALGAAVAAPDKRVVLITGDGAHQMTVQDIGQFSRLGLRPIIFVLNNAGYLIERLLCTDPNIAYNDIAAWRYAHLPHAFGCTDWYTATVTTCGELDEALAAASNATSACYIEVVTDPYAASELALRLHDSFRNLYKQ